VAAVVRRIAGECAFVDERDGGIRLETGAARTALASKPAKG